MREKESLRSLFAQLTLLEKIFRLPNFVEEDVVKAPRGPV